MRFILLLLAPALLAAGEDTLVARGYQAFYNLQYDRAIADFTAYAARRPEDPAAYNHLAQAILYRDMFRAGALETELVTGNNPFLRRPKVAASEADRRAFDDNIRRAMELAQARLDASPGNPSALYALGVSYGLRANYNFLVRKAWRDALRDATAARKAHGAITEADPGFVDARMVQGLHDYVIGSLPLHWKLLGFLVGFRGSREEGIRTVELVAAKGNANRLDAEFLLCAIYRREKQPARAIPLLKDLGARFPRNYLLRMELAQMYSELGENAKAIAELERLRAARYPELRVEKICYAEGNIQFWAKDYDAALENLKQAAAGAEDLDLNTGVLAWMRLGQVYDLKGMRTQALAAYRRAAQFAPDSEAAKESRGYMNSPYRRASKT